MTISACATKLQPSQTGSWQGQVYEVCQPTKGSKLRAVVFAPEYETLTKTLLPLSRTEFFVTPSHQNTDEAQTPQTFGERVTVDSSAPTQTQYRYLKRQYIGYLNTNDEWVDKNNTPLHDLKNFRKEVGEHTPPKNIPFEQISMRESKTNLSKEDIKHLLLRLEKAPPCTVFAMPDLWAVTSTTRIDLGKNTPFVCAPENGGIRKKPRQQGPIENREIVIRPDGEMYGYKDGYGVIFARENQRFYQAVTRKYNGKLCEWNAITRD
ncbi:MAG: hypothetical protein COA43_08815 [Robiginitomaculum sp.]|nr:MAG: hypothetical protein COA43_08815 [Robiginitomaculum sp.]